MPNIGFSELALILFVAFLVLGPKELPNVIRFLSRFMRQCREAIDECRAHLDGLGEESGLKELEGEKRFIRDQMGELREIYDVGETIRERKARDAAALPKPESGEGA